MRYLPLTDDDRAAMLSAIGVSSIDDLFCDVPESARRDGLVDLPLHKGEAQVDRDLRKLARSNMAGAHHPFFVGAGAYRHYVPATVDHLIQRSEFLTAYTPYQPEISQGTLQYLFEFQTQVALITGMQVANASMYDGSTACAEAALMAMRLTRKDKVVMAAGLHPQYAEVVETTLKFGTGTSTTAPFGPGQNPDDLLAHVDDDTACVIIQNPDVFGEVRDLTAFADKLHETSKALLIVVFTEAVSLGALKTPGAMGADIVVGEGQSIGNALNFGGPYVGLMATRQKFVRQMPGRLAGETVDADGKRGFVLTLSTREQHIRREKATSNICTNSGLCALAFTIHMSLLGDAGFRHLAQLNHARAVQVADRLAALPGVELVTDSFFNEFTLRLPKAASDVVEAAAKNDRVLAGVPGARLWPGEGDAENLLIIAVTECAEDEDIDALETALKGALS